MDSAVLQILVVEPTPEIALVLREQVCRSHARAHVEGCREPGDALALLARTGWDVVVLSLECDDDLVSDVVGEIERSHSGLPLVLVTRSAEPRTLDRASMLGPSGLLVAPVELTAVLNLAGMPPADAGLAGTCAGVPTAALVSLHCAARRDGVLHLRVPQSQGRPERTGTIHLEGGQPVHAATGGIVGAEAADVMLRWVEAEATFVPGQTRCPRTILGRWEGLFVPRAAASPWGLEDGFVFAHPEVIDKLSRLAHTPGVFGAYLLRHGEVVIGHCAADLDEGLASSSLRRLARVFADLEAQPEHGAGTEIQASVGSLRLVIDRVGPPSAGFQIGVLVRQGTAVCKSLRRLLRQIDLTFARHVRGRGQGAALETLRVA